MMDCTCFGTDPDRYRATAIHSLGCPALGGQDEWDDLEAELRRFGKLS